MQASPEAKILGRIVVLRLCKYARGAHPGEAGMASFGPHHPVGDSHANSVVMREPFAEWQRSQMAEGGTGRMRPWCGPRSFKSSQCF